LCKKAIDLAIHNELRRRISVLIRVTD